ncbi:MAG: acyl-CoA dehydrogenase family protein [Geminicoccaceae bacterium]
MDIEQTDEQAAFVAMARDFAANAMQPHALRWDREKIFPVDTLREAAALGMAAMYVDPDHGGSGLSRLDAALIFEELSAACASTAAYISIHNMVAWMVDRFGDDRQRADLLPKLASMEWLTSYCLTEPGSGSDAASLKTKAVLDDDHYVLEGAKAFISGGGVSDLYAVMARTGGEGPAGISCILVEKGTAGLSFGQPEVKMGWNSQPTAMVLFDGCRVPVANRLGDEGEGFRIAMQALDGGRINIGSCSLGSARACMERARAHMTDRRQFGQRLADFQGLQFRLAEMATELEAARLMVHKAARSLDAGSPDRTLRCAMAKRFATDTGFSVANRALQLFGGYGYIHETGIERHVRDCRVHQILEGTNEIMNVIIARELLRQ